MACCGVSVCAKNAYIYLRPTVYSLPPHPPAPPEAAPGEGMLVPTRALPRACGGATASLCPSLFVFSVFENLPPRPRCAHARAPIPGRGSRARGRAHAPLPLPDIGEVSIVGLVVVLFGHCALLNAKVVVKKNSKISIKYATSHSTPMGWVPRESSNKSTQEKIGCRSPEVVGGQTRSKGLPTLADPRAQPAGGRDNGPPRWLEFG